METTKYERALALSRKFHDLYNKYPWYVNCRVDDDNSVVIGVRTSMPLDPNFVGAGDILIRTEIEDC